CRRPWSPRRPSSGTSSSSFGSCASPASAPAPATSTPSGRSACCRMRFLFTTFEGGGHVPPALLVARRLRERGHDVLVLSDTANRDQAEAQGLTFRSWRRAP